MTGRTLVLLLVVCVAAGAAWALTGQQDTLTTQTPDTARAELDAKVAAIFTRSCATAGCHSGEHPKMMLDLSAAAVPASLVGVAAKQAGDLELIDPADPAKSYLLMKLNGGKGMKGKKMPLKGAPLTAEELAAVSAWVAWFAGAMPDTAAAPLQAPQIKITPGGKEKKK